MSKPEREIIADTAARWVARSDAGLTPAEREELARWRADDPRHAAALAHYSSAWSALDRPADQGTAVVRELRRRTRRRQRLTGGLALLVLIGGVAWRHFDVPTAATPAFAAVETAGMLRRPEQRILPDGSVVELKPGAAIEVAFTPEIRRVLLLHGEVHFEVTKDAARPFAVDVGGVVVRAVGTAFSVQRDVRQVDVVVTEGRVAVEQNRPISTVAEDAAHRADVSEAPVAPVVLLDPGERVLVPVDAPALQPARVLRVSEAELAQRLAWRAPRLEFSSTPLSEAVAMMNRAAVANGTRWTLVVDPTATALQREPVTGVFRADNSEAFVRMLELSLGITSERNKDRIVLRAAP